MWRGCELDPVGELVWASGGVYLQFDVMPRAHRILLFLVALTVPLLGLAREKDQPTQSADSSAAENVTPAGPKSCDAPSLLMNFPVYRDGDSDRQVPIWRLGDGAPYFFAAGMTIDADGSPNAYNAENTGLDDLANAGQPGHWDGVLQDADGNPLVQGPDDPFPGYYISCTSLADRTKRPLDPTRFVDASKIPYIVLPREVAWQSSTRLGDFAVVMNLHSREWSYAIFADVGTLGEGSIALADNLGIWSNARRGGSRWGVFYLVFPGSGNGQPRPIDEIDQLAAKAFQDWGGTERLNSCAASETPPAWPWRH
jgi:Fungal chitosanase of glycosyl hydrolase group 75